MSRWDIFRWRTLAGGPPCRQGRQRFSHRALLSNRPKRVPPFVLTCRFGRRRAFATGKLRPTPRKLFEKSLTKNFYARSARLLARTCAILSMSTSGSELPKARIESPGTGQNFYARYRSAPLCTCVA